VTDDKLTRPLVQHAVDDARDNKAHRLLYLALALVVAGIGALGWLYVAQGQQISRLVDAGNDSAKQSQALASQVRALGATPIVQPAVPAPAGPTIIPGKDGAQGAPGVGIADIRRGDCSVTVQLTDGRSRLVDNLCGKAGTPGGPGRGIAGVAQDGCFVTVTYSDGSPATRLGSFCGPSGADGKPGVDGQTPPCMSTPAKCQGVDGKPGTNGANGTNGKPGATGPPGPTCPSGYELRDAVITAPDGSTYRGKACVDPSTSTPPKAITVR
jgi:hypothetical protein